MINNKDLFKTGLKDGIAIALGYLSVSFTFGLMSVNNGLSIWQSLLISMCCLTSAGQFAGLDIIINSGGYIEMLLTQIIINIRYSLMSVSLSQKADESMTTPVRLAEGFGITDEIFAVSMSKQKEINKIYMAGLIILPYFGWATGTLLGAIIGSIVPEIITTSLGIAIYGMFLAIIIPPAREDKGVLTVVIIAVILSSIIYFTPVSRYISSGFRVIIVGIAAACAGAFIFPVKTNSE